VPVASGSALPGGEACKYAQVSRQVVGAGASVALAALAHAGAGACFPSGAALAAAVPAAWGTAWTARRVLRCGPKAADVWMLAATQLACHLVFCLVDGHAGLGALMMAGHGLAVLATTAMMARLQHAADGLHGAVDRVAAGVVSVARWALGAVLADSSSIRPGTVPAVSHARWQPSCGRVAARKIRRRGPPAVLQTVLVPR
jgi:hypothetical protein